MEVGMVVSDITSSISTLPTDQTAEKQTAIHTYVCTYDVRGTLPTIPLRHKISIQSPAMSLHMDNFEFVNDLTNRF